MTHKIVIQVCGRPKTGKTTVINLIEEVLTKNGFKCSVEDYDYACDNYCRDVEKKREYVSKNTEVCIKEVFFNRDGIIS